MTPEQKAELAAVIDASLVQTFRGIEQIEIKVSA